MQHHSTLKRNVLSSHEKTWRYIKCIRQSQKEEKKIPYANTYIWNLRGKKKGHEEPSGKTGIKTQTY